MRTYPLHHGGATPDDAGIIQRFIDSDAGVFVGSFSHTIGAMAFTAGVIAYVAVANSLKRHPGGGGAWRAILPYAQWFTLGGIVANGVGGVMRLYQSDHPPISALGTSLWVQVLLVKHLFLMAGVGLAIWVTWRTRVPAATEPPFPEPPIAPARIRAFAIGSFATILAATVLGAIAAQAPLPGAADPAVTAGEDVPSQGIVLTEAFLRYRTQGTIRGTPVQPASQDALVFPVPQGALGIHVELSWFDADAVLVLGVLGPDGQPAEGQAQSLGATHSTFDVSPPLEVGEYTVRVSSDRAIDADYEVRARVELAEVDGELLEATVTLPVSSRFFEINLDMGWGNTFEFAWNVVGNTNDALHFDIHTHRAGEVQYHEDGNFNSLEGSWTQDSEDDGGVSLLWAPTNADGTPMGREVRLAYRVSGPFDVVSVAGP